MNPLKKKPRTKNINPIVEKPEWLRVKLRFPTDSDPVLDVRKNLTQTRLNTVCESASCPNLNNCWSRKTATYMLAGDICTRRCSYCDVASGKPKALDKEEPIRVAESVEILGLRYVVITAVNRDDLTDGGASQFYETVLEIKKRSPECRIELLIPDLKAKRESLDLIYSSKPDILNHNIETVRSLFKEVAPAKNYDTSLKVLKDISEHGFITKSGIILGLGETLEEAKECIQDLRANGVSMLTIGQYMQPTPTHHPVKKFVLPEVFEDLKKFSYSLGYKHVESGPLVRSSYHADEQANFINHN